MIHDLRDYIFPLTCIGQRIYLLLSDRDFYLHVELEGLECA